MKNFAPIILLISSATLFLLIMGSEHGSWVTKGAFLQIAPALLFIHSVFVYWLIKYRSDAKPAIFAWFIALFVLTAIRISGIYNERLVVLDPRTGGRWLFALAVVDIILGYCIPWRRPPR